MEVTYVEPNSLKNLEGYAVALVTGMLSLKTLENFHIKAVDIGILKEDQTCRCNTIVWDIRRCIKLYQDQLESVLELLPSDFNAQAIVEMLKKQQLTKARSMTRKKKAKE